MPAVHCHFPITVRILGRLDEDSLARLAAEVEQAVAERIASAETELHRRLATRRGTVAAQPGRQAEASTDLGGTNEPARESGGTTNPVASPSAVAEPGNRFLIHLAVNEPISAAEFSIRALMQGLGLQRDEAKRLIDSGALRCYGWASSYGVGPEWVNHPIPFWVESRL